MTGNVQTSPVVDPATAGVGDIARDVTYRTWDEQLSSGTARALIRGHSVVNGYLLASPLTTSFAAVVKARVEALHSGAVVTVDGHDGWTSTQLLAAGTPGALSAKHGLILYMCLINDYYGQAIPPAQSKANHLKMIADAKTANGTPYPATLILTEWFCDTVANPIYPWSDYVRAMHEIAADDPTVRVLNIGDRMGAAANALDTWDLFNVDGVHPNIAGHALIARFVMAEILANEPPTTLGSGGSSTSVPLIASNQLLVYGHGYSKSPGVSCTSGQEFFSLLATQTGATFAGSAGVRYSRALEVARDVNLNIWDDAAGILYFVDCEREDLINYNATSDWHALTTAQKQQMAWSVETLLAFAGCIGNRVEAAAGTVSGTWARNQITTEDNAVSPGGPGGGGSGRLDYTAVNGAYIDMPLTITSDHSGVVYVLLVGYITWTMPDVEIYVDGVLDQTITSGGTWESIKSRRTASMDFGWRPVRVEGLAAGAHTIQIKTITAGTLGFDCLLLQKSAPPPVVYFRDQAPVAGSAAATLAQVAIWKANKALVDPLITTALANFPHVITVDHAQYLDPSCVDSTTQHPNNKGMKRIAARVLRVLGQRGENGDY